MYFVGMEIDYLPSKMAANIFILSQLIQIEDKML